MWSTECGRAGMERGALNISCHNVTCPTLHSYSVLYNVQENTGLEFNSELGSHCLTLLVCLLADAFLLGMIRSKPSFSTSINLALAHTRLVLAAARTAILALHLVWAAQATSCKNNILWNRSFHNHYITFLKLI